MADETEDLMFDGEAREGGHPRQADPVEALTWALLDDQITQDEIGLLDTLLLSDEAARGSYLECVQLHTDLLFHFSEQEKVGGGSAAMKSPVLGFLSEGALPFGVQPPNAEDSRS
jgi:hypothetical protein